MARDRRSKERYRVDLPAKFRLFVPSQPHITSRELHGRVYDISEHGLRLLSPTVQSDGLHVLSPTVSPCEQCLLSIEIETPEMPLSVCGKAIWYDRVAGEAVYPYHIGVSFLEVPPEVRIRIMALCTR